MMTHAAMISPPPGVCPEALTPAAPVYGMRRTARRLAAALRVGMGRHARLCGVLDAARERGRTAVVAVDDLAELLGLTWNDDRSCYQ
jgi:hypothetical protein